MTHWKAKNNGTNAKRRRRRQRHYNLLFAVFGPPMKCCTPANPCCPERDDDWIRNFIDTFPYIRPYER